mmetsp:Transcript_27954/g.81050  ORF Transcript_27954/g.81050 Transcript_27954/m.81050 type:complete len:201 (+) Transcript_27954:179-781(+)
MLPRSHWWRYARCGRSAGELYCFMRALRRKARQARPCACPWWSLMLPASHWWRQARGFHSRAPRGRSICGGALCSTRGLGQKPLVVPFAQRRLPHPLPLARGGRPRSRQARDITLTTAGSTLLKGGAKGARLTESRFGGRTEGQLCPDCAAPGAQRAEPRCGLGRRSAPCPSFARGTSEAWGPVADEVVRRRGGCFWLWG